MLCSIGDQVREGTYRLHSRFDRAVNFTDGRRLVTIVDPSVGGGPINIVMHRPLARGASSLRITRRQIHLGIQAFDRRNAILFQSSCPPRGISRRLSVESLAVAQRVLLAEGNPRSLAFLLDDRRRRHFQSSFERRMAEQIAEGARLVFRRRLADAARGARLLSGCGFGLTPSGDDFLCGTLMGMNLHTALSGTNLRRRMAAIFDAAETGNLLSATSLRMARDGRLFEPARAFVYALLRGRSAEIRTGMRRVLSTGETSGADFATGLVMTLNEWTRTGL